MPSAYLMLRKWRLTQEKSFGSTAAPLSASAVDHITLDRPDDIREKLDPLSVCYDQLVGKILKGLLLKEWSGSRNHFQCIAVMDSV